MVEEKNYNEVKKNPPKVESSKKQGSGEKTKAPVLAKAEVPKKKGLIERFIIAFVGPNGIRSVGSYLFKEMIVPSARDIVANSLKAGIDMTVGGMKSRPNTYAGNTSTRPWNNTPMIQNNRTNYSQPNQYSRTVNKISNGPGERELRYDVQDYVIPDRNDAMAVLDYLRSQISDYGQVSLADYYDCIGVNSEFTDHAYGWSDLSMARLVTTRGGYAIDLPQLEVI